MADPPPERKPQGQSNDAHFATGGFARFCVVFCIFLVTTVHGAQAQERRISEQIKNTQLFPDRKQK